MSPLVHRLIQENAEQLRFLHQEVKRTVVNRSRSAADRQAWEMACRNFHEQYDRLAFPRGLQSGWQGLLNNTPEAIELAVSFLEANPLFFRSGYIKADIIKQLKKLPLSLQHRERLQTVVLARVNEKKTPREFRAYCQLAKAISDSKFRSTMAAISQNGDAATKRHAKWVLDQLL